MARYNVNDVVLSYLVDDDDDAMVMTISHILEEGGEDNPSVYRGVTRGGANSGQDYVVDDDDIVELLEAADRIVATMDAGSIRSAGTIRWNTGADMLYGTLGANPEPVPQPAPFYIPADIFVADTRQVGVTTRHYRLQFRDGDSMAIFELLSPMGTIRVTPTLNAEGNLEFRDPEGNVWLNSFQQSSIGLYANVRDINNVNWMRRDVLLQIMTTGGGAISGRRMSTMSMSDIKRKKLRQKYDKMPTIKEERYYAGKEFIA